MNRNVEAPIERLEVAAFKIPTDRPESDGTFAWNSTTLVAVHAYAEGEKGFGYTYADTATAQLVDDLLQHRVLGLDALDVAAAWRSMVQAVRNLGRQGIAAMAISAVDAALWDLKCHLLDLPLVKLLGASHEDIPVYGSGGFTSYSNSQLADQLSGWVADGISMVKMKVGRDPEDDLSRVKVAREAIGNEVHLFVDANGGYSRKQALKFAERFAEFGVTWFEEPVSSDDLEGLHFLKQRTPAGMEIAAGEYGYDLPYFRRMLEADAVDVLQADVTRCAGVTGFVQTAVLCGARGLQLSAHCAPSLHVHPCCAIQPQRHLEYFHDHVRIEQMLFDGARKPVNGALRPDLSRPGFGLELKHADAAPFQIWGPQTASV